ncbi:osmotically inducible protein OsmC [Vibrio coralliilyticus]|nr:osmotically inducible protein OsmC [Vibrio coralliilyticus]
MQAEVKWIEDFKFLGHSQSGHSVVMDGNGGATAPSPMEIVG